MKMLQVVLLALLVVGCTCMRFQVYNPSAWVMFENYDDAVVFPEILHIEGGTKLKKLNFEVHRVANGLDFETIAQDRQQSHVTVAGGIAMTLNSLLLEFMDEGNCKLTFNFKSESPNVEWKVASVVYKPPPKEDKVLTRHALEHGVRARTFALRVPFLLGKEPRQNKVDFDARWTLAILRKVSPRLINSIQGSEGITSINEYAGVPVIVHENVLEELYNWYKPDSASSSTQNV